MDEACFQGITDILSLSSDVRKHGKSTDCYGPVHFGLFGDFKQLPPASSRAPFVRMPSFACDFEFRCLRENRRVVREVGREEEIQNFHEVLTDISQGKASERVREFMIDAYVRGRAFTIAEEVPVEGSTTVVTRRRYRDKWNRKVVRIAFLLITNGMISTHLNPCPMRSDMSSCRRSPPTSRTPTVHESRASNKTQSRKIGKTHNHATVDA